MLRVATCLAVLAALVVAAPAPAAWEPGPERFGEVVTRDVEIPMPDGVVLRADVYAPALPDGSPAPGPFPVLVSQTPYGKEAAVAAPVAAGYRPYLIRRGYIQALVDVRGQGASEGSFQLFGPDEMADSRAVIDWASKLPRSTGAVGMTGESYLGITQLFAAAAAGRNSPLKAIFPIIAANDAYRDLVTSGGLLNLASATPLVAAYGALPILSPAFNAMLDPQVMARYPGLFADRLPDLANGFSAQTAGNVLSGGDRAYDGAFWRDARRPGSVLKRIVRNRIPAFLVGGLYDVFQRGEPLNFAGLQNAWAHRRPFRPMRAHQRVTGRYQLLMKPEYHVTIDNGEPDLDLLQLAWFDRWLKGEKTGIEQTKRPLHIVEPDGTRREAARFPLPSAPVRTFYLRRVLAGPLAATLYATATTTDTEWIAKVSDVAPDGTSVDLTQGALLGSHRALDARRTWRTRGAGRSCPSTRTPRTPRRR